MLRLVSALSRRWSLVQRTGAGAGAAGYSLLRGVRCQHTQAPDALVPVAGGDAVRNAMAEHRVAVAPTTPIIARSERVYNKKSLLKNFYDELERQNVAADKRNERRLLGYMNMCHNAVLAEPPEVKVKLAQEMWQALRDRGVKPSSHIYNILLRVYNDNGHIFKPSEFLEEMQADGVFPNLGTFTLLIAAYCSQGNIVGATKLLEYMKTMDFPMSESIYASLITGHARAGNIEAAERVIASMKSNRQRPHNVAYTSLLCAYAEKGDIDAIERVFGEMRMENLFPSMVAYTKVINSLSQSGHASLVQRVLDLIKSKEWLSSDFRSLAVTCLCRGEVATPRILLKQLAQQNGLNRILLSMYLAKCLEQGQPVTQLLQDIEADVDLTQFPGIYDFLMMKLLFMKLPMVVGTVVGNQPPESGELAPHPLGALWTNNMLEMCSRISPHVHGSHYYYPILARHCSDANVEGVVVCLRQMLLKSLPIEGVVRLYVEKAMSNAGTTMEEYTKKKLEELDRSGSQDLEFPLFSLLYSCSTGEFQAALQLVNRFKDSSLIEIHTKELSNAIKSGHLVKGYNEDLILLFKYLLRLSHPPDLSRCLDFCSHLHISNNKPLVPLLDFFSSLELSKVDVVTPKNYLYLISNLKRNDRGILRVAYRKLKFQSDKLEPKDYGTIFKAAVRTGSYGIAKEVYKVLSPEVASQFDVRNHYLLYLTLAEKTVMDAVELLNTMIAEEQVPSFMCWFRLIPEVMKVDLSKGSELIQQMISCGLKPSSSQRQRFLQEYVDRGHVEESNEQFEIIKSEGWAVLKTYLLMVKLWAEKGDIAQVEKLLGEAKRESWFHLEAFSPSLILVQLKNGNYEEAVKVLTEMKQPSADLVPILSSLLVEFIKADVSIEPILDHLKQLSLAPNTVNSLLFFALVDGKDEARAASVLEEVDMLDRAVFDHCMTKPNGREYLSVLKSNGYHLKHIRCAYLMKSGYLMTNDEKGLRELIDELDKCRKTDWLWKQL